MIFLIVFENEDLSHIGNHLSGSLWPNCRIDGQASKVSWLLRIEDDVQMVNR